MGKAFFHYMFLLAALILMLPSLSFAQIGDNVMLGKFLLDIQGTYSISVSYEKELLEGRYMPKGFKAKGSVKKNLN